VQSPDVGRTGIVAAVRQLERDESSGVFIGRFHRAFSFGRLYSDASIQTPEFKKLNKNLKTLHSPRARSPKAQPLYRFRRLYPASIRGVAIVVRKAWQ